MRKQVKILFPLTEMEHFSKILEDSYPLLHACSNNGINDFVEPALLYYHKNMTDSNIGEYIESFIDQLDFRLSKIQDDCCNNEFEKITLDEIYSNDFFIFMITVFKVIISILENILHKQTIVSIKDSFTYIGNSGVMIDTVIE